MFGVSSAWLIPAVRVLWGQLMLVHCECATRNSTTEWVVLQLLVVVYCYTQELLRRSRGTTSIHKEKEENKSTGIVMRGSAKRWQH